MFRLINYTNSYHSLYSMVCLEPEDGTGGGADTAAAAKAAADKAAADKAIADKAEADKAAAAKLEADKHANSGLSDKEAALLKESMSRKAKIEDLTAKLKEFDGIDVAEIKKMLADKVSAEKATAEKTGDYERVKKMMADEHAAEVTKLRTQIEAQSADVAKLTGQIGDLTIGSAFSSSDFIGKEMVLPPNKARQVYGSNFEIEEGAVIAYDKPKGSADRTKLVDASGKPLAFDEAIKRIVAADPDHASLLKSKLAAGARSTTADLAVAAAAAAKGLTGASRIEAILNAQAAAAKKK